jgi:hypothetical protein
LKKRDVTLRFCLNDRLFKVDMCTKNGSLNQVVDLEICRNLTLPLRSECHNRRTSSKLNERPSMHLRGNGELILSAGALSMSKLLILNGIGPASELERLGIKQRIDLPVGDFIKDPPVNFVSMPLERMVDSSPIPLLGLSEKS